MRTSDKLLFPSPHGDYFLTENIANNIYIIEGEKFPSPYGDYFFNEQEQEKALRRIEKPQFPSPYGDYFFNINVSRISCTIPCWNVSVPLWGLFF